MCPADPTADASSSEAFSKATLDALSALIGVIDQSGTVRAVNRAWRNDATLTGGYPEPLLEGDNFLASCDRASGPGAATAHALAAGVRQVLVGQSERFSMEYQRQALPGGRWFRATVTRFVEHADLCVIACADITARKQAEARLAYLAQFDALTSLPNRALYLDRLGHMLIEAERDQLPVSVLVIDRARV
jgi:PAS domain-containing protein